MQRWLMIALSVYLAVLSTCLAPQVLEAEESADGWISKIISIQGNVVVMRQGERSWRPAQLNDTLLAGDQIRVTANSRAGIVLSNDAILRLDQNTTLILTEIRKPGTFVLKLLKGAAHFFSRRLHSLEVATPFINGVVEGTEFFVQVDDDQTVIDLFEGRIRAENSFGSLQLSKSQRAIARSGKAPQSRILVRPRDSVQWALYYPLLPVWSSDRGGGPLQDSVTWFNQGQPLKALAALPPIPEANQDTWFLTYRAGLLLHLGRVNEARNDIQQALALDANSGAALALKAIIAVVQNQKDMAMADAQKAVHNAPRSAAAQLALSYACQARFDLDGARKAAQTAVAHAPENAIAWARLSELQLCTGDLDKGIAAAQKAVALNPSAAHAHTMLGFAFLMQIKTDQARGAFNQAINLDSAAPLPRLGLGLAEIRQGKLSQGRGQIEIAAGLDPDNSLIRSYLGKAYFDEKRDPLDARQLEIAKTLDPNDPTPWFYDAIRKQTLNRPVEALQDLQKSIALNDNRAVYRSRLLLDEDLAARSASLGRIYNDLDFQHIALLEGYKSLGADSTNYSAHRLLADNYAAKPRHEIARVSELLQSQLFQPLNVTPIQAHLSEVETGLITGAGPAELSFNEFNPLFFRSRLSFQANGMIGNNNTIGDELTVAGISDHFSGSFGSYHYETNGFRENNDFKKDDVDLFLQGRLTPKVNLQVEYRYSERQSGDLSQYFDGYFSEEQRISTDLMTTRIGLSYRQSSQFEVVSSFIHSDSTSEDNNPIIYLVGPYRFSFPSTGIIDIDGDLYEVRTDFKRNSFGTIAGISYMDGNYINNFRINFPYDAPFISLDECNFFKKNAYLYSTLGLKSDAELTLGISASSMKVGNQIQKEQVNPKIGLTLRPLMNTTLRLAAFRGLSSTYVSSQTIEPTHVAGFSQFFDDLDASDVKSYGAAIDQKITNQLFSGVEYLRRDLEVPQFDITSESPAQFYQWKEYSGMAYLYWLPTNDIAVRTEYQYERFNRREKPLGFGLVDIETHRFPLSLSYFHSSGIALKFVATYFLQKGDFESKETHDVFYGSDNFWLLDSEISYRLPKQRGTLSVGMRNILDEKFKYLDTDPSNPNAISGSFVYGKIILSF